MKDFPASYETEKNRPDGASPILMLKTTINGVDRVLSDVAVTVPGWWITCAWVKSWGNLTQGVTGALDEFRISDFSATCIADPDVSPNIVDLALVYNLEKVVCILYLWFAGSSDGPQEIFRGYIRDYPISDGDTICTLKLQDETVKWQETYVGRKLTLEDYPNADPDDVGKVIPIPFGTVKEVPALCIEAGIITSLTADITAAATSITLGYTTGLTGKHITIGDEILHVSSVSGLTATVIRGHESTTAAPHKKGAQVMEKKSTPLVYISSDVPIDSFGRVNVLISERLIDITDSCTLYTGQTGSEHATYTGKAIITLPDFVKIEQGGGLGELTVDEGSHAHPTTSTFSEVCTASLPVDTNPVGTDTKYYYLNFPASAGTRTEVIYEITINCIYMNTLAMTVEDYGSVWSYSSVGTRSISIIVAMGSRAKTGNQVMLTIVGLNGIGQQATIMSAKRTITINTNTTSGPASGVTVSGNSIADTVVGSSLYVDMTRAFAAPADVFAELLDTWGGVATFSQVGTLPASYALNFVINEYRRLPDWLHDLAWQCRGWLRHSCGAASLTIRDTAPESVKTLAHCAIESGKLLHSRDKTPYSEIINDIVLLFNRDWKQSRSDKAYRDSVSDSSATSITDFGKQQRPELFLMDAVTDPDMAADLLAFYLAWYSVRHWLHDVQTDYRDCELEFTDPVTIGFAANVAAIVLNADMQPNSDIIKLILIQ
jgi:hypothetical protein